MKKFLAFLTLAMLTTIGAAANTYTVAGSSSLFTSNWDETDSNNDMTLQSDGTYKLVIANCELSTTGTYEFKVVKDRNWNDAWPSSNYVIAVPVSGTYDVTFTFNPNNNEVNCYYAWTVAGSAAGSDTGGASDALFGTSWEPTLTTNDMTDNGDGTWTLTLRNKTLPAGTTTYKVVKNHAWTESYPSSNATLTIPAAGTYDVNFTFNASTHEVSAAIGSAKAIWCEGNHTLYFTWDTTPYAADGTYDSQTITEVYEVSSTGYSTTGSYDSALNRYHSNSPWDGLAEAANRVVIADDFNQFKPTSLANWFYCFKNLNTIANIDNINTSSVTDMENTFAYCSSLNSLDLRGWDTSNVTFLKTTFRDCSSLTSLKVSNWDTSKVTNLGSTFSRCSGLTELDVKDWDTSNVTNMGSTFFSCSGLTSLDVSKWNTGKTTNFYGMFYACNKLTSLEVSNWDTKNVTNMSSMFYNCKVLASLGSNNVKNWDMRKVTTLDMTFSGCNALTTLDVSGWTFENLKYLSNTFDGCKKLTALDVSGWNVSKVTSLSNTFNSCELLTTLAVDNWNTASVTNMSSTFSGCKALTTLNVGGWNTAAVTSMSSMFSNCRGLTSINVKDWNTEKVNTLSQMFYYCNNLTTLDVSKWDTKAVTNMKSVFETCANLPTIDVSGWNTANVTKMNQMFAQCYVLDGIDISGWNTEKVDDMSYMFSDCHALSSLNVSNMNTASVTNMAYFFNNCYGLISLDVNNWNTGNVTNMNKMFNGCNSLTSLTLGENFTTGKVTSATETFKGCSKLRYLDFYESNDDATHVFSENNINRTSSSAFLGSQNSGLPMNTVVYLPHGISKDTYNNYSGLPNLVFNDATNNRLIAEYYLSTDKVDIEFPRTFQTNRANYSRDMTNKTYGSVVLPYAFTSNDDIQAYALTGQNTAMTLLTFTDVTDVPAHTPFAFKKLGDAKFFMNSSGYGITVNATRSTKTSEKTWDPETHKWIQTTTAKGAPYDGNTGLTNWKTKGYYVAEDINNYEGLYFIQSDKVKRADGTLNIYDHRALFYPTDNTTSAKFFNAAFSDEDIVNAIEAAEMEKTIREAEAIYDMQGRQQNSLRKGVNIIRMSDGTTKKVVIK